jgi:hypothetical protein
MQRHDRAGQASFWLTWAVCVLAATVAVVSIAQARDAGQWDNGDQAIKQWFSTLMQPDLPTLSCCGESDAYWADKIAVEGDKVFAIITDDRPDEPLKPAACADRARASKCRPHKIQVRPGQPDRPYRYLSWAYSLRVLLRAERRRVMRRRMVLLAIVAFICGFLAEGGAQRRPVELAERALQHSRERGRQRR